MINVIQTSQVLEELEGALRFVLVTHHNPDGDAIGSLLGLRHILRECFPEKDCLALCVDDAPANLLFLPKTEAIIHAYEPRSGDCVIFLDSAEPKLTELHSSHAYLFQAQAALELGVRTVKIDHHPIGSDYAQVNIVDSEASSTAEMIYEIADGLAFAMTPDAATCLLTGIYTDTGSMMHSNTRAKVYRTCAALLSLGADQRRIVRNVFRTSKLSTLRLWGRVLERVALTEEGGAVSAVLSSDFRTTGADFSELTGAIDYVNSIPGMRFSMILSEREGKVKGSLRTLKEDVDVATMAQRFSGGGHRKAAGFAVDGTLEKEVRWKVIPPQESAESEDPAVSPASGNARMGA